MEIYNNPYDWGIKLIYNNLTSERHTGAEIEAARKELLSLGESWTPADVERIASQNSGWKRQLEDQSVICSVCATEISGPFVALDVRNYYDDFLCLPCAKKAVVQMEAVLKNNQKKER